MPVPLKVFTLAFEVDGEGKPKMPPTTMGNISSIEALQILVSCLRAAPEISVPGADVHIKPVEAPKE